MTVLILALVGVLATSPQAAEDRVVVGVLEQPQCKDDPAVAVRALFQRRKDEWVALSSENAWQGLSMPKATWTVAFDGRCVGSVISFDPGFQSDLQWFSRDRLLLLVSGQAVPSVPSKGDAFAGWCSAPTRRPLVVVSRPFTQDPDVWKPFRPSGNLRSILFAMYKAHAGSAVTCPRDSETAIPFDYVADDLIFSRSYRDRFGTKLVVLGLDERRRQLCDGPGESAWSWHSFVVTTDSEQYVGQDLTLVDAGDYDGDGRSELLFWYSGYDEDGYSLFYDGFRKRVDYRWQYH